jgi:hypothetical protein
MLIYADFNRLGDEPDLLKLDTIGSISDLTKCGYLPITDERTNELHELYSKLITFYMDDGDDEGNSDPILVDGYIYSLVCTDIDKFHYEAKVDWSTLRHESEEK